MGRTPTRSLVLSPKVGLKIRIAYFEPLNHGPTLYLKKKFDPVVKPAVPNVRLRFNDNGIRTQTHHFKTETYKHYFTNIIVY